MPLSEKRASEQRSIRIVCQTQLWKKWNYVTASRNNVNFLPFFFPVSELIEFRYCLIIQIIKDIVPPGGVGGGAGVRDAFFFSDVIKRSLTLLSDAVT